MDAAYQLRLRVSEAEPSPDPYPDDESVVATATAQAGLRVARWSSTAPGMSDCVTGTVQVWRECLLRRHPHRVAAGR